MVYRSLIHVKLNPFSQAPFLTVGVRENLLRVKKENLLVSIMKAPKPRTKRKLSLNELGPLGFRITSHHIDNNTHVQFTIAPCTFFYLIH